MSNIVIYMVIGTLFTGFLDIISTVNKQEETTFTNLERFFSIMLWPILLMVFLYNMFRRKN